MPIDFEPGGAPVPAYALQRLTEDAFVGTAAMLDQQHDGQGGHTNVTLESLAPRVDGDLVEIAAGLRFTLGPWVLDADGNPNTPVAAIRVPQITANQNDYNPPGLATALVVELDSDAARTITGLVTSKRRRILKLVNRSNYTITLSHNSGSSTAAYRFAFSGSVDYPLRSGGYLELYYEPGAPIWRGESMGATLRSVQRATAIIAAGDSSKAATLGTTLTDLAKAEVRLLGFTTASVDLPSRTVRLELTNTTTLTAFRGGTDEEMRVSYEVSEWG
jgi:hypothetical protein